MIKAMSEQQDFQQMVADESTLTLGDRINFPYILAQQINTFQRAKVKEEGEQSFQEVMEAAKGFYELIPDAWRTKKFEEDMKKAIVTIYIDQRRHWCGVPIGDPQMAAFKFEDPDKIFHACINLVQARGLLARILYTEVKTGNEYLDEIKEEESS